jgi:hypothetical protein
MVTLGEGNQENESGIPWLASREGDEIYYELVFYREAPYSVRLCGNGNGEK